MDRRDRTDRSLRPKAANCLEEFMKTLAIAIASALTAIAPLAYGQTYGNRDYDRDAPYVAPDRPDYSDRGRSDERNRDWRDSHARVIDSRPVYAQGGTHEECWNEETHSYEHHGINAGTVLGAIAGGVIGHQVGSGRGNDVATAAGAIGGGVVGSRIERNREDHPSSEQRCRTVSDSGSGPDVVAYDVRYQYRGREFTTRLDHQPGRYLTVGQEIREDGSPLDGNVAYDRR
jgi:uncharacterized protein YcfJ